MLCPCSSTGCRISHTKRYDFEISNVDILLFLSYNDNSFSEEVVGISVFTKEEIVT